MRKSVTILLGVAAGAAFAYAAYTNKGRKVRKNVVRKIEDVKDSVSAGIERKARRAHDSGVIYS